MSTETFDKGNLDAILKELAKEYRKLGGKAMPAEIVLIGGAAVIENYGFREMTTDIDAVIMASSVMKDAINHVGDRLGLANGWLNDDFKRTASYSSCLNEVSAYYKSFYGVLNVRTVSGEYLIAMKLKAGRKYKNDFSDIVGILAEHKKRKRDISFEQIAVVVEKLYGGWDAIPGDSVSFIHDVLSDGDYENIYAKICDNEKQAKEMRINFEEKYPGVTNAGNVNTIIASLKAKRESKTSVLQQLQDLKKKPEP